MGGDSRGITLISLLMAIFITSILMMMGRASLFGFQKKAKQSEAIGAMGAIHRLAQIKIKLNAKFRSAALWSGCESDGCILVKWTGTTDCNVDNPLDFEIDCSTRYYYRIQFHPTDVNKYVIRAHEIPSKSYCQHMGGGMARDKFYRNWCGKICNYETYTNNCDKMTSDCGDIWSCS